MLQLLPLWYNAINPLLDIVTLGISILNYVGELFKAVLKHMASSAIGHQIDIEEKQKEKN